MERKEVITGDLIKLDVTAPELTALLEALPGYVLLIDERHRILAANSPARAMAKAGSADFIGGFCPKVIHGSNESWPGCPLEEAVQKGQREEREVFDEQTGRWLTSGIYPLPGTLPDGRKVFLHTINDITAAKHAEHVKDDFLAMVSHELKTPLTIIIGALHTANSRGIPEAEAKELLRDAIDSAVFLAGMVENLLELSRVKGTGVKLNTGRMDFDRTARDVFERLSKRSPIHRISLDVPPGLPAVSADQSKIERILCNLMENAIKYSPEGGDVTLSARPEDRNLKICVGDHGPGISAEEQKKLFQTFEESDTNGKGTLHGMGLGLKVCRTLVEAHGGRIWVESKPGRGTNIFFTLPLFSSADALKKAA